MRSPFRKLFLLLLIALLNFQAYARPDDFDVIKGRIVAELMKDKVGDREVVHLSNQEEKGRWSDITDQKNISQELVTMDVFKLWFDHGKSPDSASYAYIVVPNASEQQFLESGKNNRDIEIMANNSRLQGVINRKLGICQLVFYSAGEVELSDGLKLRMDSPGMAMLKLEGDKVKELTVSDPSRKLGRMMVSLSGFYEATGEHVMSVSDADYEGTLIIVDLPQDVYAGKSVGVSVSSK